MNYYKFARRTNGTLKFFSLKHQLLQNRCLDVFIINEKMKLMNQTKDRKMVTVSKLKKNCKKRQNLVNDFYK
jgi:hypothetical protein